MKRTPKQVAQQEALARRFFEQRFGLNLDDGGVSFGSFTFNPANNYRAYTIAGESVPAEGWVVRDGGFMAGGEPRCLLRAQTGCGDCVPGHVLFRRGRPD